MINIEKIKLDYATACDLAAVASDAMNQLDYKTPKVPMSKIIDRHFVDELRKCLATDTNRAIRFLNAVLTFCQDEIDETESELKIAIKQNSVGANFYTDLLDQLCYWKSKD